LFEAEKTDIAGSAYTSHDHEHIYYWFVRTITFYTAEVHTPPFHPPLHPPPHPVPVIAS